MPEARERASPRRPARSQRPQKSRGLRGAGGRGQPGHGQGGEGDAAGGTALPAVSQEDIDAIMEGIREAHRWRSESGGEHSAVAKMIYRKRIGMNIGCRL